jgi:hypothetical protein
MEKGRDTDFLSQMADTMKEEYRKPEYRIQKTEFRNGE